LKSDNWLDKKKIRCRVEHYKGIVILTSAVILV